MSGARTLSALAVGLLFGVGLALSQMTNPEKVLSFLTLATAWDPSLALVMGAAVVVAFVGYRFVFQSQPLFDTQHHVSDKRQIDGRLLAGAAVFGVGWGLAGYCPGPAIAGLASGSAEPWVFLAAMIAGSQAARIVFR